MAYKGGKYEVLGGREELMLESMAVGIEAFVGSNFNFAGDLFNLILDEVRAGAPAERLRALQLLGLDLVHAWMDAAPAGTNGYKYFGVLAGLPVGPPRLPQLPMPEDGATDLKTSFTAFCAQARDMKVEMKMCSQTRS